MLLRVLSSLLCLCIAAPAFAGPEVHIVAVRDGVSSGDWRDRESVRVRVDRPDTDVTLVLVDDGDLVWHIATAPGTRVVDILRGGTDPGDSVVRLNDIPLSGETRLDLPLALSQHGRPFRKLIDGVGDWTGVDRVDSFRSIYQAQDVELSIRGVDTLSLNLARDPLAGRVSLPADLPNGLSDVPPPRVPMTFDATGLTLAGQFFPADPNLPPILLPVAAVQDSATGMAFLLTLGGVGYIYTLDPVTGVWDVFTDLGGYDAAALRYDPITDTVVTTGAFARPGEIRVFGRDGERAKLFVPTLDFPGLADLFNFGNEDGPPLVPIHYRDGWLVATAQAGADPVYGSARPSRRYAISLATGAVHLLGYDD